MVVGSGVLVDLKEGVSFSFFLVLNSSFPRKRAVCKKKKNWLKIFLFFSGQICVSFLPCG